MGIFDIFNRDEEKYKGFTLSPDVDIALQKQLIDRGRGNEVNSMTPDMISKANSNMNVTANSTPAIISPGKNSLAPENTLIPDTLQVLGDSIKKPFTGDTPIFGIQPAYSPAEDSQPGNLDQLKKEKPNSGNMFLDIISSPEYLKKENIAKGGVVTGFTGGALTPDETSAKITTLGDKILFDATSALGSVMAIDTIGGAFGKIAEGNATIGSILTKYPKVTKYVYPFIKNAVAFDVYGQLDPNTKDRFSKLAKDTLMSVPYTGLGFIKKVGYSMPAAFALGFGLSKLDGASTEDAIIQGGILSVLDATGRLRGSNVGKGVDDIVTGRYADRAIKAEAINVLNEYSSTKLNINSSEADIQRAYREAAHATHPDVGGSTSDFQRVNAANQFLTKGTNVSPDDLLKKSEETNQAMPNAANRDLFKNAVDEAKMTAGETPDIIKAAVAEAQKGVVPGTEETAPLPATDIYHQTNADVEAIKNSGFVPGKNSSFGEAAFFSDKPADLYGGNQIKENTGNYKLKNFPTVAEQQDYIAKHKAANLADAVRAEGTHDGFVIPHPEIGNVVGITNTDKLNSNLNKQQFITTAEAKKLSEQFPFIAKMDIPLVAKNNILTASGQEAFGRYSKGIIEFLDNPHKTTIPHEAVHAYIDLMMTPDQKKNVINEAKRRFAGKILSARASGSYKNTGVKGLSDDAIAEEILAEDMINYAKTGKAGSNKLKRFYDWLIAKLKELFGKGNRDIISKFYEDIQKSPNYQARETARKKLRTIGESVDDVRKEYMQNPDALTTKFLENVDVKNREIAGYDFLKNLLKSKSLPLKEVERNLIESVLDTEFKGEKKIVMSDLRDAIKSELMPLQVIESETYADYGSSEVGMTEDTDGNIFDQTTDIYNSPYLHGYTGHFGGDFSSQIKKADIEIKQIPGQDKWAVIKKGEQLTAENLQSNVYTVADSEKSAQDWVDARTISKDGAGEGEKYVPTDFVELGGKGLFGHARIWKVNEPSSPEYGIRYISEIQSDAFQNDVINKSGFSGTIKFNEQKAEEARQQIDILEGKIKDQTGGEEMLARTEQMLKEQKAILDDNLKSIDKLKSRLATTEGKNERLFSQYKNTWFERIIREEIRRGAMEGDKKMRVPTPYTVAKIEGYLSANGQIPTGTAIGDTFDYGGEDYMVLEEDQQMGNDAARVIPNSSVRGIFDYDTARQEDIDREKEDLVYDLKKNSIEDFNQVVDENYIIARHLSNEETALMKKDYKKNQDLNTNVIDDLIDKAVEAEIDSRYTDNEGYAGYYNEDTGEEYVFPLNDTDLIILNDANGIETMSYGGSEADKENFNYEEDLDSTEQRTVARFYDKQVSRYLAKLRKGNFRTVTDDRGNDWYETDILPEDKVAVEAFQTKPAEKPMKKTGKQVANYVNEIEKENDSTLDDHLRGIIEQQDFTLQSVRIKSLLAIDQDLRKYVEDGEQRYPDAEEPDNADLPIVVGSWLDGTNGVLDGWNRVLTKFETGDDYIEAWVAPYDYSKMTGEQLRSEMKFGRMGGSEELRAWGMDPVASFGEMADVAFIGKKPALAVSWLEGALAGISVHPDFQRRGLATAFIRDLAKDEGGKLDVYDPNEKSMGVLKKLGKVSEADGRGVVTLTLDGEEVTAARFQEMTQEQKDMLAKRRAERIVKQNTTGKITLKNALNIVRGIERPITITKKESVLLKNRLRDMAKASKGGYALGRAEMRADLNLAFAGKLQYAKMIKGAIIAYAQELPGEIRGSMLTAVSDASTMADMAKAFARIDAALKNYDIKDQLQRIKKMAKKVKKAMASGKGIAVDYQKKIADVLNDYNLQTPTAATVEKLSSLSDYIAAHPEANIPDHLLKRLDVLKRKSPKELGGDSLRELNDLLGRLWSLGELKLAMKGKYDERFINASVDRLLLTTQNVDKSSIPGLSLLHAPRVADIFDGFLQYKGQNVQLQKKINRAVSGSVVTTKNIVEDAALTIAAVKDEFTREEQAAMAFKIAIDQKLLSQAQSLLDAYADEFKWKSEADIKITPEMQTAIDTLRGTFNSTVDYLAAVYEEIENKPFIKTDNYFPIKYDRSFDQKLDIEAPTVGQMADFASKQISKGFTFRRVKGVKKVLRIDIFNVFSEAVAEQQYYMRVQPVINEIANIVNDARYQDRLGKVGSQWWDLYLKGVANKGKIPNFGVWKSIDPLLRAVKIRLSNAVLGYKIGSALIQPTSIIDAYSYVYLNHGIIPANGLIMRLAATLTLPGYSKNIVKKSIGLQIRTGGELTIREMQEQPAHSKFIRAYQEGGMWLLKKMDLLTAAAVQKTMFQYFKRKGMSISDAQSEADFVMNLTQGSSEIADMPLILTSGELAKTILTFQTFVLNRWGLIAHDMLRSAIYHGNIGRKLKGLIALLIISMAGGLENLLRTKAQQIVTGIKYPDKLNFVEQSLLTAPEAIPVFGSIITSVIEYNQGATLPITRVLESLIQGAQGIVTPAGQTSAQKELNRTKGALKFSEAAASLFGLSGSAQLSDLIQRVLIPPTTSINAGNGKKPQSPARPKLPTRPKPPKMPKPPMR